MNNRARLLQLVGIEAGAWGASEIASWIDQIERDLGRLTPEQEKARQRIDAFILEAGRWAGRRTTRILSRDFRLPGAARLVRAAMRAFVAIADAGGVDHLMRQQQNAAGGSMVIAPWPPKRQATRRGRRRPAVGKKRSVA